MPEGRPLIVYGTINPGVLPHELNILRQLVATAGSGAIRPSPYLWVRLTSTSDPRLLQPVAGTLPAIGRDRTGALRSRQCSRSKLAWDLPKEDALHLAQLMAAADIVVTTSSTLSIDAAWAGTPIINVFFDGAEPVHPAVSARRFMHYTHYVQFWKPVGSAKALQHRRFRAHWPTPT